MNQEALTKNQAAREARQSADAVIEQLTRWSKGWDKGQHSDNMRDVDRNKSNTIAANIRLEVNHAFTLSAQYGQAQ